MDMIGRVRRLKLRDALSISEISRKTGLSRNTVKKWLRSAPDVEPKYRRADKLTKLQPFEATLAAALKADARRPREHRRTGKALFIQIQAQGYRGGYSAVTDFIRAWREQDGKESVRAFVPLSFELGEAFQFDWSEEGIVVGGVYYQAQVAHLKLCASRAFWLVAYPSQGHEMLFDAHTRSFAALGGVARRGIYDNMKTAVDKVNKGKGRIVNARFAAMLSTGQQCTAILHMLLLENVDPLLMDQPEDNLDNAFIADRIVAELREAKTSRQFLFATHNANIPVFGDAEWIGVFTAAENQGRLGLEAQGSIDVPVIRDQVASILEGGRDAFIQRKEKYEF